MASAGLQRCAKPGLGFTVGVCMSGWMRKRARQARHRRGAQSGVGYEGKGLLLGLAREIWKSMPALQGGPNSNLLNSQP